MNNLIQEGILAISEPNFYVEQITKADRLHVSRPLQKWQSPRRATAA